MIAKWSDMVDHIPIASAAMLSGSRAGVHALKRSLGAGVALDMAGFVARAGVAAGRCE